MKVICRPRVGGKTTELVRLAHECDGILLTWNHQRAQQIENDFPDMRGKVFDFDYFYRDRHRGMFNRKIFIDDLDEILHHAFGYNTIEGFSVTGSQTMEWDQ